MKLPQTHTHAGGSTGGPGQNSAFCTCGITFDGFDTQAEVVAEVDAHIAGELNRPPTYYDAAAELRRIADDLDTLTTQPCPAYFALDMQPGVHGNDQHVMAAVDAVAMALLGHPGEVVQMSGGAHHYQARGARGPVNIGIYNSITSPDKAKRDAELAALRAEVERLHAERAADPTGLRFSREADAPEAGPVADGIECLAVGRIALAA